MNHKVHLFMRGCLTLKFSGSWNTVISSLSLYSFLAEPPLGATFSSPLGPLEPSGEMGIVSSGTGEEGLPEPLVWTLSEAMVVVRLERLKCVLEVKLKASESFEICSRTQAVRMKAAPGR